MFESQFLCGAPSVEILEILKCTKKTDPPDPQNATWEGNEPFLGVQIPDKIPGNLYKFVKNVHKFCPNFVAQITLITDFAQILHNFSGNFCKFVKNWQILTKFVQFFDNFLQFFVIFDQKNDHFFGWFRSNVSKNPPNFRNFSPGVKICLREIFRKNLQKICKKCAHFNRLERKQSVHTGCFLCIFDKIVESQISGNCQKFCAFCTNFTPPCTAGNRVEHWFSAENVTIFPDRRKFPRQTFCTNLSDFDNFWQFLTIFPENFRKNVDKLWQMYTRCTECFRSEPLKCAHFVHTFFRIFDNFWHFWQFLTISDIFDNFWQFFRKIVGNFCAFVFQQTSCVTSISVLMS